MGHNLRYLRYKHVRFHRKFIKINLFFVNIQFNAKTKVNLNDEKLFIISHMS